MRHCLLVVALFVAAIQASAQDSGFREVSTGEPFMGAPLGVGIAKGGLGFSWGTGRGVAVFDLKSGDAKGEFAGHGSDVTAGAGCPGARIVATGDASGAVRVWDPSTRKEKIKIETRPSPVRSIAWAPGGAFLAVVTEDRVLTVWRVDDGSRVLDDALPATGAADVLFSPEGDRLVLLRRDREERDGEIASGLQLNEYDLGGGRTRKKRWERRDANRDADPYAGARADARARRVALMDGDEVLVWALDDEREVCRVSGGAEAVAWRRDGKLLVSRGRELVLANAQSGKVEKRWPGSEGITWLVASDDNRTAVGGGPRGGTLWKLGSGDVQPEEFGGASDAIVGKGIIVVRDASGRGTAIRTDDGAMSGVDGDAPDPSTGLPGICASFEDDTVLFVSEGRPVAHNFASASDVSCGEPKAAPVLGVLCAGESVAAWGAASWTLRDGGGKELMKGPGRPVKARGRWLAVRAGHRLSVLDANAGREIIDYPSCDAFDLANDSLAVLDNGEAVVFNLARNREPFRMSAARATDIALSPDGRTVAFDNGALTLWDVASAKKTSSTDLRGPLAGLQFHPGGAMLAALTQGGEFRLINEDGTSALKTTQAALPGDDGPPFAFSPDGTRMALAWSDGLRFYDLEHALKASILRGSAGAPEFAPKGERWILRNGASAAIYEGPDRVEELSPDAADFTPSGALAAADRAGVRIWDGRWKGSVTTESATDVSVSDDGKRIAVAAGTRLLVFEK